MEGFFFWKKRKKKTKRKREATTVGLMAPLWCATHTTNQILISSTNNPIKSQHLFLHNCRDSSMNLFTLICYIDSTLYIMTTCSLIWKEHTLLHVM